MFDASGRFIGYRGVGRDISSIMRDKNRPHAA